MSDKVFINDLTVACTIGVFEHERHIKQNVIINIGMHVDLGLAGKSDDINDTVSYHDIVLAVTKMVEHSKFHLLEALAESIAKICLKDKRVHSVQVKIEKPKAIPNAKSSAVEITRTNE